MSRRKQARPKALTVRADEEEDNFQKIRSPIEDLPEASNPGNKQSSTVCSTQQEDGDVEMRVEESCADEKEVYRCEECGESFTKLSHFMDHRNYDCMATDKSTTLNHSLSPGFSDSQLQSSPVETADYPASPRMSQAEEDSLPTTWVKNNTYPYQCEFCEISFQNVGHLKKHEQIHADQSPFSCETCQRLFRHKRSRDRHMKTHMTVNRNDSQELLVKTEGEASHPFMCSYCSCCYDNPSDLETHMVIHGNRRNSESRARETDSMETMSGSSMPDEAQLSKLSIPGEETPCEYCEKIFMSRAAMEFHVGQMHGDKCPFQCPVCLIQLTSVAEMFEHIRWHSQLSYSENSGTVNGQGKEKNGKTKENGKRREFMALSPGLKSPLKRVKLECEACGKTGFETEEILQNHVTETHGLTKGNGYWEVQKERSSSREPRSSSSSVDVSLFPWLDKMCCVCQQRLDSSQEILEHIQKEHPTDYVQMVEVSTTQNGHITRTSGGGESFPCELCPINFMDSESLQMHLENVHKKMGISCRNKTVEALPVLCVHCSLSFPTILSLAQHMQTAHNFVAGNTCTSPFAKNLRLTSPNGAHLSSRASQYNGEHIKCERKSPKLSPQKEMENHFLSNGQEALCKCDLCPMVFAESAALDTHISKVHGSEMGTSTNAGFTCIQCHMTVDTEEEFENHVTSHYLALDTEYGCTSCMKLFHKPDELQKHLIDIHAHHMYRCSLCKEIFDSKVNIQVHFSIKHSNECKLYTCTQCNATFRSEMEWQLHVKVQHLCITKAYRCLFCKDSFTNDDQLQTHLSTHKKQFPCRLCKESFHVEYLLDKHMQEKHANSTEEVMTSYPVSQTPEASPPLAVDLSTSPRLTPSKTPSTLRAALQGTSTSDRAPSTNGRGDHMTTPPMPKMYKCEICSLTFTSEEGLHSHKSATHKVTNGDGVGDNTIHKNTLSASLSPKVNQLLGSDKFGQVCVYCTQNFKTKTELEKHMKSHMSPTKQKCNICDQVFPSASSLAEHKLSHCKVMRGDVCVVCKLVMKNEDHFYLHSQEHGVQGTNMTCIVCRQTLSSILELQLHGKAHFQIKPIQYTCCVCLKHFSSKDSLMNLNHSGGKNCFVCKQCYQGISPNKYACLTCSATFNSQVALDSHYTAAHKKSFQCIKCQESFKTEYEIQAHVASHMVQEGNMHECRICNRTFDSPAKLQCHLIDHTFEGSEVKCYVCDVMFNNASEIQMHVLSHDVGTRRYCCSQCSQTFFFSAEMQNHLYVSHGVKASASNYQCPDCTKIFTNVINLNNHRKLHATLKDATLKCTKCPLTFRSFTEVQQHFVSVHSPQDSPVKTEKPESHNCSVCGEMFSSVNGLNAHASLHNTGAKYSCSKCSKSFQSYQNFETHMKSHDNGGPFVCSVCQKGFSRKESMRSHMKCHTGIKPYRCDKCTLTFSHRGQLKDHMTTHVNQTGCETCGKSFDTPKDLWRHQVIMHNMKTGHTCHICNSTYSDASDLEFHMKRVHGLEKISWSVKDKAGHRCVVCNSPYKNLKDLEFHVQQIHGFNTGRSYQPADIMGSSIHTNDLHLDKNGVHKVTDESVSEEPVSVKHAVVNGNNNQEPMLDVKKCRTEEEIILLKLDSSTDSVCVNGEGEVSED